MATVNTTWGTSPAIPIKVEFESSLVRITLGTVQGNSYFGYPIYVDVYRNSTLLKSGHQIKAASSSQWNQIIAPISGLTSPTRVRIWASGSGVTRGAINIYSSGSVSTEGGSSSGGTTEDDTGGGATGGGSSSGSGSAGSTITEASFGLSCGTIVLGASNTLTVVRPNANYTPTFSYSFGSVSGSFTPTLSSSATTKLVYLWTPDISLASQIPNNVNGSGTITMKIGGYTKQYSFIATVPETMIPTASLAVDVVNDNASVSVCAKGLSRLAYTVTAAGVYGSTIAGYEFSFAGQTLTDARGETGLILSSGKLTPSVTVTDSRGRRATASAAAIEVYDYSNPVIRESFAVRRDSSGAESEDGAYLYAQCTAECSDLGGTNEVSVKARYKPQDGDWSGYTAVTNGNGEVLIGQGLASGKSYTVEIVATDTVGNSRSVEHTSFGSAVAFHLKQGGNGAAFGKYSEDDDCLDCLWDAKFHGNVEVDGDFTIRGNKPLFTGKTLYDMGLLDLVYPVGAVYISATNITPATIFGGSWTAISGKFLLSADSSHAIGTTGGEEYKTLQPANLPVHSHGVTVTVGEHYYSHSHVIGADKDGGAGSVNWSVHGAGVSGAGYQIETSTDSTTLYHNVSATVGSTGEGQSFSVMPPYLSVYMWQRTA